MKESVKAAAKQADAAKAVIDQATETAKTATGRAEALASEFFNMAKNPTFEIPAAVRELAERSIRQAKEGYDRFKAAAEDATGVLEDTYSTMSKGFAEVSLKSLDTAKDNTNAAFDFARDLVNVRSFAEAVELQTAFVRQRLEAGIAQTRELATLVNKVANDSIRPVREGFERSAAQWKQAAL